MERDHEPAWAVWLEASALGEVARDSLWLYPLVSIAHVLGIGVLIGSILAFDLRVLGAVRAVPVEAAARLMLPIARTGFTVIVLSGVVMLTADATHIIDNPAFLVKMGLLALALANVVVFHRFAWPSPGTEPHGLTRVLAGCSVVLWLGVATCGRSIAYF